MMKALGVIRSVVVLLTVFMLAVGSMNAGAQPRAATHADRSGSGAAHPMMMSGSAHCDGCPAADMPATAGGQCANCIPWLPQSLLVSPVLACSQLPFASVAVIHVWSHLQSPPWKPPRSNVFKA